MKKNIFKRIYRKIRAMQVEHMYSDFVTTKYLDGMVDIFDYHEAVKDRRDTCLERGMNNYKAEGYGIGSIYRRYTGFSGIINCSVEHSLSFCRINNEVEYRDIKYPVIISSSTERWNLIQPRTPKLVVPCGPFFIPYAKSIYDDFTTECIKKNIGKTLLVFPQHNNVNSFYIGEEEKKDEFVAYVNDIKDKYHYDTVLCCVYFADILNQTYLKYEKLGWRIVSAGRNTNYDFGDNMKTILSLADYVIAQGSMASIVQAVYMKKPSTYIVGRKQKVLANGVVDTPGDSIGHTEMYKECGELFGGYSEEITKEQYDWCNKWGGFDDVKTPEEMRLILEFAQKLGNGKISDARVRRIVSKKKYEPIQKYILPILGARKGAN